MNRKEPLPLRVSNLCFSSCKYTAFSNKYKQFLKKSIIISIFAKNFIKIFCANVQHTKKFQSRIALKKVK